MEEGGFGGVCSQGPVEHFLDLFSPFFKTKGKKTLTYKSPIMTTIWVTYHFLRVSHSNANSKSLPRLEGKDLLSRQGTLYPSSGGIHGIFFHPYHSGKREPFCCWGSSMASTPLKGPSLVLRSKKRSPRQCVV